MHRCSSKHITVQPYFLSCWSSGPQTASAPLRFCCSSSQTQLALGPPLNHRDQHCALQRGQQTRSSLAPQLTAEPLKWNSITTGSPAAIHQQRHCGPHACSMHTGMFVFAETNCVNVADSWVLLFTRYFSVTSFICKTYDRSCCCLHGSGGFCGQECITFPIRLNPINTSRKWSEAFMFYRTVADSCWSEKFKKRGKTQSWQIVLCRATPDLNVCRGIAESKKDRSIFLIQL